MTLRGVDGANLAHFVVAQVNPKSNVLCRCQLLDLADRIEVRLLKELVAGADELAFAVMASIEEDLAMLGVVLQQGDTRLALGVDFFGLVLTEGGVRAAFQLAVREAIGP